jgi:hypothetical protein
MFNFFSFLFNNITNQDLKYKNLYECFKNKIFFCNCVNVVYKFNLDYLDYLLEEDQTIIQSLLFSLHILNNQYNELYLKMPKKMNYIKDYYFNRISKRKEITQLIRKDLIDKIKLERNKDFKLKLYKELINSFQMDFTF